MTYPITSADGVAITSWAGTFYSNLLSKAADISASLNIANSQADVTQLGGTTASYIPGLRAWDVSLSLRFATSGTPATVVQGTQGLVTFSAGGYALHVPSMEFELSAPVFEITSFASTPPAWRAYRPGRAQGTFRFLARVDNATGMANLPGEGAALPTLTLRYGDENTDDTVAGSAILTGRRDNYVAGQLATVEYSGVFTGSITPAGTNTPLGTSVIGVPLWDLGVADATKLIIDTGAESWGGDAFWRRIRVAASVGEPVSIDVDAQGTNALAVQ